MLIRTLLVALGLLPFVETIGGKGLRVAVPLKQTARLEHGEKFPRTLVRHFAQTIPQKLVTKNGLKKPGEQNLRGLPAQWFWCHNRQRMDSAWTAQATPELGWVFQYPVPARITGIV